MSETLTTEQMLNLIQGYPDCQDAVLIGGAWRRSYNLGCCEEEVYGLDPDGNEFEMPRKEFLDLYSDAKWTSDYGWESGE